MNSPYAQCSLYLHPLQHDFSLDNISSFVGALQEIGFISRQITPAREHYTTGDKFLGYITYMGCSPAIQFEPGSSNGNYCHIRIHRYDDAHLLYSKAQAKTPQCPDCRKPLVIKAEEHTAPTTRCDHCQADIPLQQLNWRKMAGYARLMIEVTDIFPKEAIPQQSLLDNLAAITGTDWKYFYSCS